MTAFYMFRLYAMTFLGKFRGTHEQEHHLHESPPAMTIPLMVLAFLAVVGGFIGIPEVFAENAHWLDHFLLPVFAQSNALSGEQHLGDTSHELIMMGIVTVLVHCHHRVGVDQIQQISKKAMRETTGFGKVLENKWYVDEAYDGVVVKPCTMLAGFFKNMVEKSGIDGLVNGSGRFVQYTSAGSCGCCKAGR